MMKKFTYFKFLIVIGFLLSNSVSNAQITIEASDFTDKLDLGDQVTTYLDTIVSEIDLGGPGQFSLDYSSLSPQSTFVTESKTVANSPYISDFPDAQYASNYEGIFAGVQSNTWVYNSVPGNFLTNGTGTVANSIYGDITTVISFAPAWIEYTLPMNLNDQNTWSGKQTIKTITTVPVVGQVITTIEQDMQVTQDVNGYGTIKLPGNKQINVLRIVEVTTFTKDAISNSSTVIKFLSKTGEIVSVTPSSDANIDGIVEVENVSWTSGDGGEIVVETPSAPDQLFVVASTNALNISWSDNSDNETGFYIERSDDGSPYMTIDSVSAGVSNYSDDAGLMVGIKYSYRVRAYSGSTSSAYSNVAEGMLMVAAVSAPDNLLATVSESTAELSWNDNSENEVGFYIERSEDGGAYQLIDSVAAGVTAYLNSGLVAGIEYMYRIRAYSEYISSEYSNIASVYITPTSIVEFNQDKNSLGRNYPNPVKNTTTISFQLEKNGRVQLFVLNADGRLVRTLVNGSFNKGSHHVNFETSGLESGTYFYRLQGQGFVQTKSMMIVK